MRLVGLAISVSALAFAFSLGCSKGAGASSTSTAKITDGKVLFTTYCARCHGEAGMGGPSSEAGPGPRNFCDKEFHACHTDEQLRATIVNGKGTAMPAFGATFDDEQLKALIGQLRAFGK